MRHPERMSGGTVGSNQDYKPGYEIAAEQILAYIAEQGLGPGDRLPTEQQLCNILNVSRSVGREAVKVLSALGRVNVRKGAGLFVADGPSLSVSGLETTFQPADLDHVEMLFEFRLTIEPKAARLAAIVASPAEVRAVARAADRSREVAEDDDFPAFRGADLEFHGAVAVGAHNMFLVAAVDQIARLKRQVLTIGLRGAASGSLLAAAEQHIQIASAIAAGDPERADAAMAEHVKIARTQFRDGIRNRLMELVRDQA